MTGLCAQYEKDLLGSEENRAYLTRDNGLEQAMAEGKTLCARAILCDTAHNLTVDLGNGRRGLIPRREAGLDVSAEPGRDPSIITRIGRGVCFRVCQLNPDEQYTALLSRRQAQRAYLDNFLARRQPGDVLDARITHLAPFGAFADIGYGISALLFIDHISVSRIDHPRARFTLGQDIKAVIRQIDREQGRIFLSHRELLGTWAENAAAFTQGQTVLGIARSVEPYGIFVELTPNLTGLAEFRPDVKAGDRVSVFIKNIIPEKMKCKLIIIDCFAGSDEPTPFHYFIDSGHLDRFVYSPPACARRIETVFDTAAKDQEREK